MYQETKRSTTDEQFSFSNPTSTFGSSHPLFRDISDLPRSAAPDFVSSSSLTSTPDVYRSIEESSGVGSYVSAPSWNVSSSFIPSTHAYGHKELDITRAFSSPTDYGWSDPYHFDKTKSIEDLRSPLIQSFPASNASAVIFVPPSLPEYIDPCYHFACKTQATDLFQSVLSSMKRSGVDVEPKPEKFRMRCKSYPSGSLLCFVIRIYRDIKKSESVVECQRRSGCVLRFSDLYKSLKRQVDPNSRDTSAAVSIRRDTEINSEHSQETTQCLLLMASSHFVDVKSKAVEALASLSGQDRNMQDMLIKNGSINLLLDGCAKFDKVEDVHRPSLTALANLSDGRADVCRTIADKSLRCLSEKYTSPTDNCPQVVRECARVLTNIGLNLKDTMRDECVNIAVKNLSRSNDPLALQRARELEDCLLST